MNTGRKSRAEDTVLEVESVLRHRVLVAVVNHGGGGLGRFPTPRYEKGKGKERLRRVQEELKAAVEDGRSSRSAGMRQQWACTRWEQAMDRKTTWIDLGLAELHRSPS